MRAICNAVPTAASTALKEAEYQRVYRGGCYPVMGMAAELPHGLSFGRIASFVASLGQQSRRDNGQNGVYLPRHLLQQSGRGRAVNVNRGVNPGMAQGARYGHQRNALSGHDARQRVPECVPCQCWHASLSADVPYVLHQVGAVAVLPAQAGEDQILVLPTVASISTDQGDVFALHVQQGGSDSGHGQSADTARRLHLADCWPARFHVNGTPDTDRVAVVIRPVERQRLADTQAGCGNQPDQRTLLGVLTDGQQGAQLDGRQDYRLGLALPDRIAADGRFDHARRVEGEQSPSHGIGERGFEGGDGSGCRGRRERASFAVTVGAQVTPQAQDIGRAQFADLGVTEKRRQPGKVVVIDAAAAFGKVGALFQPQIEVCGDGEFGIGHRSGLACRFEQCGQQVISIGFGRCRALDNPSVVFDLRDPHFTVTAIENTALPRAATGHCANSVGIIAERGDSVSTNYYWNQPTDDNYDEELHIGRRAAAGRYCWDCDLTLVVGGNTAVHTGAPQLDVCPTCGKKDEKRGFQDTGGAMAELFGKEHKERPAGVRGVSSFTWDQDPEIVGPLCRKHPEKPIIRNEYGDIYTGSEFLAMLESNCPIQFTEYIGRHFS